MHPIALCYGTRPQVIKASVLRKSLALRGPVVAIDTGQHYDYAMNALLYAQLEVDPPDHFLEVGSGSHAVQTATVLMRMEELMHQLEPRAMVVIGDTNSTLGSALAACKAGVPVAHVEAGLRAKDSHMPEEINRKLVDAIGTLLCTPGAAATRRLERERGDAMIVNTGDVAFDVLRLSLPRLPAVTPLLPAGGNGRYAFATLHRAELTTDPGVLGRVLETLGRLPFPVVLPLHPRTRDVLTRQGDVRERIGNLTITEPVGYLESLALTRSAALVITDSGGIQREAYWLGVPCLTVRSETEWIETIDLGANMLVSPTTIEQDLPDAVTAQIARWSGSAGWDRMAYGDGRAAGRIVASVREWLAAPALAFE